MFDIDPEVDAAVAARNEGRYADALALQQALFARAEQDEAPGRSPYFMAMFGWQMLLPDYPPALPVLYAIRDEQVGQLLGGARYFGPPLWEAGARKERFSVIVQLNDLLDDAPSTCALFAHFDVTDPDVARRYAGLGLPALVACKKWALADRYRRNPLDLLAECNALVLTFPLFPPPGVAPRLAATLMGMVRDVHLWAAVFEGLGDAPAAVALRTALVDGIEDAAMRELAKCDLAEPGAISRAMSAHQMALERPTAPTGI